jgi:hypothetical protein
MTDYIYRPMYRWKANDGQWTKWNVVTTSRKAGQIYTTIGAARAILTNQKKEDQRWNEYRKDKHECEYKIQRRPLGEWEDIP